jgi:hypothetical protein
MQSFLRLVNIILAAAFTVFFTQQFAGVVVGTKDVGDLLGATTASVVVLLLEVGGIQGPRYCSFLRQLLDSRSGFEGIWLQDVYSGPSGNKLAVFYCDYNAASDSYSIYGHAYSGEGTRWAIWRSTTQLYVDPRGDSAQYLWDGTLVDPNRTDAQKSGVTRLRLLSAGAFRRPMRGEGSVSHILEGTQVGFGLQRVSRRMVRTLIRVTPREVRSDTRIEETLVRAYITRRRESAAWDPQGTAK